MTHQKVALITGITGQNGSYWPIFCWKKAPPSTASSAALAAVTPSA
jgi:hypothetical protein